MKLFKSKAEREAQRAAADTRFRERMAKANVRSKAADQKLHDDLAERKRINAEIAATPLDPEQEAMIARAKPLARPVLRRAAQREAWLRQHTG
jgi:SOS response regulatory protein OraA/RecX